MSINLDELYEKLRQQVDTFAMGFPKSPSGVEIEILKNLFTPVEAEVNLALNGMLPDLPENIATRYGRDTKEVVEILEEMVRKGTIFKSEHGGKTHYHAVPFMHGLAENNAGLLTPEMAKLFDQYEEETYLKHLNSLPMSSFVRYIPIAEAVKTKSHVLPYNQIEDILREKAEIGIGAIPCYCRDRARKVGQGCEKPMEDACFMFGWIAEYSAERGHGRMLSLTEALEIQHKFEEEGLITMPTNLSDALAMCHCCGCCCFGLRGLKMTGHASTAVGCDYFAEVDSEKCTGCETCIEWCPMETITMKDGEDVAEVDRIQCLGCGVCASKCPEDAIEIIEKPENEKTEKPINSLEYMVEMSKIRGIDMGSIF